LWGESTPLNPTPNASTTSSIEAIIKSIHSTTPNEDIEEDVAKVLDLYIKVKNKVYKCTACILAIELVVLRDAVAKARDGGTALEEEDLVILVIVVENIKEDWNTICNFFNNTWALDTNNTVLFPQSHKHLAIFTFTTKEGRLKAISMIKDTNKDWYIVPGIETLKQSNCLFNTPHTTYIYTPDLPLEELEATTTAPIKSAKSSNGSVTMSFYRANNATEFIARGTIDTPSRPATITSSYISKTKFKLHLKGTPKRWHSTNLHTFLKSQGITFKEAEITRSPTNRQNLSYSWVKFNSTKDMVKASIKMLITITGERLSWEEPKKHECHRCAHD
jgi:hypothetical protein